jgi:hypothetical protein
VLEACTGHAAELHQRLSNLFLAASTSAARRLRDAGIPPTISVNRAIVEHHGAGSWGISAREETVNALIVPQVTQVIAPWLGQDEIAEAGDCAGMLAESAAMTLPFWTTSGGRALPLFTALPQSVPAPVPDYRAEPGGWVLHCIVLPALEHHLQGLVTANLADENTASAFADEAIGVAHDDRLRYRLVAPLSGIYLEPPDSDRFESGNAHIRAFTDTEQGQWIAERGGISMTFLQGGEFWPPRVALEFDDSGPRDAAYAPDPGHVPSHAAALQLHGHWIAGRFYRVQSSPSWVQPGLHQLPLTLPRYVGEATPFTAHDMHTVTATSKVLAAYNVVNPRSAKDLALHRFLAGVARQDASDFLPDMTHRNAADAVLDFTIALEALLLPYDENARHGDLGYRFRLHGAYFLAEASDERPAIARQLSSIYNIRSRLVHGGKYPDQTEIAAVRDQARELARRGLLRAVHQGFPTAKVFNHMILGIG